MSTDLGEKWLTPETQLARFERQGPPVFDHVHGNFQKEFNTVDRNSILTYEDLKEKADRIEASLQLGVNAKEKSVLAAMEEDPMDEEEKAQAVSPYLLQYVFHVS